TRAAGITRDARAAIRPSVSQRRRLFIVSNSQEVLGLAGPIGLSGRLDTRLRVGLQLVLEATQADAEHARRPGPVPARLVQRTEDVLLLHVAQGESGADADRRVRRARRGGIAQPQGAHVHLIPFAEHHRLLEAVLELADVAGPLVAREEL